MTILKILFAVLMVACSATAFTTTPKPSFQPITTADIKNSNSIVDKVGKLVATVPIAIATSPLVAFAVEEADDYEYGAVNAPIGIAWAAGVLAVLTALLPLALQGGEEAFEEMKERDSSKWGTGQTNALDRKKK